MKGQSAIIDTLLSNTVLLWFFLIGCCALALGIGKSASSLTKNNEAIALTSLGYSTGSQMIFPLLAGSIILSNVQQAGELLQKALFNYQLIMGLIGFVSLIIGVYLITKKS